MTYNFRMSDFNLFLKDPKTWLNNKLEGKEISANKYMKFGTAEHKKKEEKNGDFGEVELKLVLNDLAKQITETSKLSLPEHQKPRILKDYLKDYDLKDEVIVYSHIDFFDGDKIIDYKFTQKIDKFDCYKFQMTFYQWVVYENFGKLVPAILEMNEVQDLSDELLLEGKHESGLKTTGTIKEHCFKPLTNTNIIKFRKNIFATAKKMIYLLEKNKIK
jgi:hypothetical protein